MKTLIVSNNFGSEQRISLLKIKLAYMINVECIGKEQFLVIAIITVVIIFAI